MRVNNYYKYFSFFLIILSVSSYFLGFLFGENSAAKLSFLREFMNYSILYIVKLEVLI